MAGKWKSFRLKLAVQLLFDSGKYFLSSVEITEAGYVYRVPYEKVVVKNGQRYNKMLNKQEQVRIGLFFLNDLRWFSFWDFEYAFPRTHVIDPALTLNGCAS